MWATAIWGFCASTAVACLLAWLAVTQASPLADLYLVGAIILGAASFVVLSWPVLRRKVNVEPSHLIILIGLVGGVVSLALVAGGYAWQMFRPPVAVAGPMAAPNAAALRTRHLEN